MDANTIKDALGFAFQSFSSNSPATAFSVFALLLILTAIVLAIIPTQTEITFPRWYPILITSCLVVGIVFALIGPGLAILYSRTEVAKVSLRQSLNDLKENRRVTWIIRLIAFDPLQKPDLRVGVVTNLGRIAPPCPQQYMPPCPQKYTFVANYEELRGHNVGDAVRMIGGSIREFQHVSAIIFPLQLTDARLYPANARGLLQVIDAIDRDKDINIATPFLRKKVTDAEHNDLRDFELGSWEWDSYKKYYNHYCSLAYQFKTGDYDEKKYIGDIMPDWNPLGFSVIRTPHAAEKRNCSRLIRAA